MTEKQTYRNADGDEVTCWPHDAWKYKANGWERVTSPTPKPKPKAKAKKSEGAK